MSEKPEPAMTAYAITADLSANAAGEFLLSFFNSSARWGYSTHEFQRGGFREIEGVPPLLARTLCCGCWANTPGEGDRVAWWRSDEMGLDVFLHWDGDGTIVIQSRDWVLENGDCKNSSGWEWVDEDHWSNNLHEDYYEDDAQGMAARSDMTRSGLAEGNSAVVCDAPISTQEGQHD